MNNSFTCSVEQFHTKVSLLSDIFFMISTFQVVFNTLCLQHNTGVPSVIKARTKSADRVDKYGRSVDRIRKKVGKWSVNK